MKSASSNSGGADQALSDAEFGINVDKWTACINTSLQSLKR